MVSMPSRIRMTPAIRNDLPRSCGDILRTSEGVNTIAGTVPSPNSNIFSMPSPTLADAIDNPSAVYSRPHGSRPFAIPIATQPGKLARCEKRRANDARPMR